MIAWRSRSAECASVQQELLAGNAPDVAQITFDSIAYAISDLGAVDLTRLVGADGLAEEFGGEYPYNANAKVLADQDGSTYGLPYVFSTPVLWVNESMLQQAGVDPATVDLSTWDKVAAVAKQGSGQRDQLPEGADCAGGDLVERLVELRLLGAGAEHRDVLETELLGLLGEPGDAALHRLDQDEVDLRAGDREHQAGEASAASDVADAAGTEQGSDDRGVQDVARPQPRQLEWADQAAFLTLRSEVRSERARDIQAVAEQGGGGRGLGFDGLRHGFT